MNPLLVFDCEKVVPNRFVLSLALAARTRQLNRGSQPRVESEGSGTIDTALREFAASAFAPDEVSPLLAGNPSHELLAAPDEFRGDESSHESVAASASPPRVAVH